MFLAASVVGAAIAGVQLIPSVGYVTDFSRRTATTTTVSPEENKEYAAQWSLHPEEVAALACPSSWATARVAPIGPVARIGVGNFFKLNHEYAGVVVLLLAGVSFFGARRKALRLFPGRASVSSLFCTRSVRTLRSGTSRSRCFPGSGSSGRHPWCRSLFSFAAVTLSAFGVDRLLALAGGDDPDAVRPLSRFLWIATGVLGVGALLAGTGVLDRIWTGLLYRDIDPTQGRRAWPR